MAEYANGDLEAADRSLTDFQAICTGRRPSNAIGITFVLANIKRARGRLREAVSAYQQALQLAQSSAARNAHRNGGSVPGSQ